MNDYFDKSLNLEQGIEQRVEESEAKEARAEVQQPSKVIHKYGLTKGAIATIFGVGGLLGLRAGVKGVWSLVYPPKIKKYAALTVTALFLYGVTHPNLTLRKVREGYTCITDTAKMYLTSEKEKKSLKERLEEESNGRVTLKEAYDKKETEAQAKDNAINDYQKKTSELKTENRVLNEKTRFLEEQNKDLEDILRQRNEPEKKIEEPVGETQLSTNYAQPDKPVRPRVIPVYPSRLGTSPLGALYTFKGTDYEVLAKAQKIIFVDKKNNKLSLLEKASDEFRCIATYNCSTGTNPGSKIRDGDKATPEGVAIIQSEFSAPQRNPLFGDGGYRIHYLNQPWRGQLLCGTDLSERIEAIRKSDNCTNGGLVVNNDTIRKIRTWMGSRYESVALYVGDPSKMAERVKQWRNN